MEENKQNANGQAPAAPAAAPEQTTETLAEQARIRREKLAKLQGEGKNPYEQVKYPVDADSASVKANYDGGQNDVPPHYGQSLVFAHSR